MGSRGNRLYFSDLRSNAIHTWSDEEGLGTFLQPVFEGEPAHQSVGSNGLTIDQQGRLLLMEHGNRIVSRLEANGSGPFWLTVMVSAVSIVQMIRLAFKRLAVFY